MWRNAGFPAPQSGHVVGPPSCSEDSDQVRSQERHRKLINTTQAGDSAAGSAPGRGSD